MNKEKFEKTLFALADHSQDQVIAIDIETNGLDRESELVCAAAAIQIGNDISTLSFWTDRFHDHSKIENQQFTLLLNKTLFNPKYKGVVVFHNADFDMKMILDRYYDKDILNFKSLCQIYDTLTISRLTKNNKYIAHADPEKLSCHSLKYLGRELLGDCSQESFANTVQDGNIRLASKKKVLEYNEKDAELTIKLFNHFKNNLPKDEWEYVKNISMPQLKSIIHMNWYGVPYDFQKATHLKEELLESKEKLETQIFELIGHTFKITSQKELASSLFYNRNLTTIRSCGEVRTLKPLFSTEKGKPKVDIGSLKLLKDITGKAIFSWGEKLNRDGKPLTFKLNILDEPGKSPKVQTSSLSPHIKTWQAIDKIVQYLETNKAISFLESHAQYAKDMRHSISTEKNYYKVIYPNFSAEAKSGRFKSTKPNLLGMPKKLFNKLSEFGYWLVPGKFKEESVRHTLSVPEGFKVLSVDISALDLSVVTYGAKERNDSFGWVELFQSEYDIDIHLEIGSVSHPKEVEEFRKKLNIDLDLKSYYWTKPDKKKVTLIHKQTGKPKVFNVEGNKYIDELIRFRKMIKVVNLSSSYMIGSQSLAINISESIEEQISKEEAEKLLSGFNEAFPEIVKFQDTIFNLGYQQGFAQCPFGRKYYIDCYDDLNEQHKKDNCHYEFIWYHKNHYWYVKAKNWKKFEDNVIEDLKLTKSKFGFIFENIEVICQLDSNIFDKKKSETNSKFNRPKESTQEDNTGFKLSRIAITEEVERSLKFAPHWSDEAESIVRDLIYEGETLLPEKGLLFYRVPTKSASSRYFHPYKKFKSTAKKFFPLYCQGVATTLATMALNEIREKIESENLEAQILLFVHDQIDVMVAEEDVPRMKEIMAQAISSSKPPFDIKLSGKFESEEPLSHVA